MNDQERTGFRTQLEEKVSSYLDTKARIDLMQRTLKSVEGEITELMESHNISKQVVRFQDEEVGANWNVEVTCKESTSYDMPHLDHYLREVVAETVYAGLLNATKAPTLSVRKVKTYITNTGDDAVQGALDKATIVKPPTAKVKVL